MSITVPDVETAPEPSTDRGWREAQSGRTRLPLWAAFVLAALAGVAHRFGFEAAAIWPLALVGAAGFVVVLIGRRWWQGLLLGLVWGAASSFLMIDWLTLYLGPIPWIALAAVMTIYAGVFAAPMAVLLSRPRRFLPAHLDAFVVVPVGVAGLWTLKETILARWPFDGFAWGRMAESQASGPFLDVVSWVGLEGLSFVLVLLVVVLVQAGRMWLAAPRAGRMPSAVATSAAVVVAAALVVLPAFATTPAGSIRAGAVQGNADSGLNSAVARGQVMQDHIDATMPIVGEPMDVLIWPENGADVDPLEVAASADALDTLNDLVDAPIMVGTITMDAAGQSFNSSLLWDHGLVDQYDKRHPVAFAEYMPMRDFFSLLVPDLVRMVGRDYQVGTRDPIFEVAGAKLGVAICYDTADDEAMRALAADGAEAIVLQTNNADFGRTEQHEQQLAITRLRAVESGRTVVNISTVSSSAIIAADGTIVDSIPDFEAGAMVDDIELRTGLTPAVIAGSWIQWILGGLGVLVLMATAAPQVRRRRSTD